MSWEEVPKMDPFFLSLGVFSRPVPKSQGKCRINSLDVIGGQMFNSSQTEGTAATNHFFGGTLPYTYVRTYPGETTPNGYVSTFRVIFGRYGSS